MSGSQTLSTPTESDTPHVEMSAAVRVRLEAELADADKDLSTTLVSFWSSIGPVPIPLAEHRYSELLPSFEVFATHIMYARADALVRLGNEVPAVTECIEQTLIPHAIDLILPPFVLPDSLLRSVDLRALTFDLAPYGYWEQWICSTWESVEAKRQKLADFDLLWRFRFQLPLRFPTNREPFIDRLKAHLTSSIVEWKAGAWRIKLAQVSNPLNSAASMCRETTRGPIVETPPLEPAGILHGKTSGPRVNRCGAPLKIPNERKEAALAVKNDGGSYKDAAMKLYDTRYPTTQQVKNASKHIARLRKKPPVGEPARLPKRTE